MKKQLFRALLPLLSLIPASSMAGGVSSGWVTGVFFGSDYKPFAGKPISWYQLSVRQTRYLGSKIGIGAEGSYVFPRQSSVTYTPASFQVFGHLNLLLGFYGEYGYGWSGIPGNGDNPDYKAKGAFWSVGWSKKLGNRIGVDLQYRHAPAPAISLPAYTSGLRLGMHVKF